MEKLADVAAETDLGDLDDVVPAQVEPLQAGRVAESALGQAPDVVVRQVEGLELVQVAQRLRLQLHRHAARPLRVVTLKDQVVTLVVVRRRSLKYLNDKRGEGVKTMEGSCWHQLDLAKLNPQLLQHLNSGSTILRKKDSK